MKKITLVALSVVLAFSMVFALAGCVKSDEQVIRDGLTDKLNQLKNPKSDFWQKEAKEKLSDLAIDPQQLVTAWTEGFDYKIGAIRIDGNRATIEITITCKQINPAIEAAQLKFRNDPTADSLSENERQKKYNELAVSELKAASLVTTTISVEYLKSGNTWSESYSSLNEYSRALVG